MGIRQPRLVYIGSLDDSVARTPWPGIATGDFPEVILRQVFTGDPIAVNDGYIYQSEWAVRDLMRGRKSLLLALAEAGFLKVLCRTSNFDEMPEKMAGIVATHAGLSERSYYPKLKDAAVEFGKAILDCKAYMSWPKVDIGYGFYVLCVATHKAVRQGRGLDAFGLTDALKPMTLSALSSLIRAFQENPVSIRGRLESAIIPGVVAEYRCRDEIAEAFRRSVMGLANEFYHMNFAALLAAEGLDSGHAVAIGVETRSSPLFRGLLESGSLPGIIAERELRSPVELNAPAMVDDGHIDAVVAFATRDTGAYDAKMRYLEVEDRFFRGDPTAIAEREASIRDLNIATYESVHGRRDDAIARPVGRALEFCSENAEQLLGISSWLAELFFNTDLYDGTGVAEGLEYTLTSADRVLPFVVRRLGSLTSSYPRVKKPKLNAPSSSLLNIGLRAEPCREFHVSTRSTIEKFGSQFPITSAELDDVV
jgi:hypothetical protein